MTESPSPRLAASVALVEQSARHALDGLSALTESDLDRPTPCPQWNLRALLLHLADSADAITDLITIGQLGLSAPPRPEDAEPVTAARDRTQHLLGILGSLDRRDMLVRIADRALWASTAAHVGAIEFAVHGWDITTACGEQRQIPSGLATKLLKLSLSLITDGTRHPEFRPPIHVPPTASPSDRLVGFLGRLPSATTSTQ